MGEGVGRLEIVPDYEWEAFHQFDVRRDWRLTGVFLITRHATVSDSDDVVAFHGDPVRVTPMERLDTAADGRAGNSYLVNLEAAKDATASMVPTPPTAEIYAIDAVVREWHPDEGWGVVDSPQTPGGCWVHSNHVQSTGCQELVPGRIVALEFEPADQDGYKYSAVTVNPP